MVERGPSVADRIASAVDSAATVDLAVAMASVAVAATVDSEVVTAAVSRDLSGDSRGGGAPDAPLTLHDLPLPIKALLEKSLSGRHCVLGRW
jgi:hypothetical protein